MRLFVVAAAVLTLVAAAPAVAFQQNEDYPQTEEQEPAEPPRSERPRVNRGGPNSCESSAGDLETAEEFCAGQLDCPSKGLTMKCGGRPNNYKCKCV